MAHERLNLIILAVDEFARVVAFYRAAFGWQQTVDVPVYAEFDMPGRQRLGIYEREGFGVNTGQVPLQIPTGALTGTELYFYAADIEQAIVRLEQAGARKLSELRPRSWGDEAAYYADPAGNVIVLAREKNVQDVQDHG